MTELYVHFHFEQLWTKILCFPYLISLSQGIENRKIFFVAARNKANFDSSEKYSVNCFAPILDYYDRKTCHFSFSITFQLNYSCFLYVISLSSKLKNQKFSFDSPK